MTCSLTVTIFDISITMCVSGNVHVTLNVLGLLAICSSFPQTRPCHTQ